MRSKRVFDADDEFWRATFFNVAEMKKIEAECPRCGGELLVVNSRALMTEHDKNAGVYCFSRPPICYLQMYALRPGFEPT